jgi:hypothetical protein
MQGGGKEGVSVSGQGNAVAKGDDARGVKRGRVGRDIIQHRARHTAPPPQRYGAAASSLAVRERARRGWAGLQCEAAVAGMEGGGNGAVCVAIGSNPLPPWKLRVLRSAAAVGSLTPPARLSVRGGRGAVCMSNVEGA